MRPISSLMKAERSLIELYSTICSLSLVLEEKIIDCSKYKLVTSSVCNLICEVL